jgi:hypothetical protein
MPKPRSILGSLRPLATAGVVLLLALAGSLAIAPAAATAASPDGPVAAGRIIPAATAAGALLPKVVIAAPGDPGDFNGACTLGEFCLFYLLDNQGSVADFNFGVIDLNHLPSGYPGPGIGQGQPVANNSLSAANAAPNYVIVCTEPGFAGVCGYVAPLTRGNFAFLWELNVESFYWY